MIEALSLRSDVPTPALVVVRLGARTVDDALLLRSVEQCHE
ncbi:MAG TPA: hypothetical protein VES40_16880 [Ilumatobacteraceae bacterium]|nr:hypothetical protein [Ilumatobacteraceae bacterium]